MADEATRSALWCGWMPREEWGPRYDGPPLIGDVKPEQDLGVCPGWAARQPLIVEIGQAGRAYEKGNFDAFYPAAPNVLCDGVNELSAAWDHKTAEDMREAAKKRNRGQ